MWMKEYLGLIPEYLDEVSLDYELRIRGVSGVDSLGEKRKFFRNMFRGSTDPEQLVNISAFSEEENSREVAICEEQLHQLENEIGAGALSEATRNKLRVGLIQLWARLRRNGKFNPGYATAYDRMVMKVQRILEENYNPTPSAKLELMEEGLKRLSLSPPRQEADRSFNTSYRDPNTREDPSDDTEEEESPIVKRTEYGRKEMPAITRTSAYFDQNRRGFPTSLERQGGINSAAGREAPILTPGQVGHSMFGMGMGFRSQGPPHRQLGNKEDNPFLSKGTGGVRSKTFTQWSDEHRFPGRNQVLGKSMEKDNADNEVKERQRQEVVNQEIESQKKRIQELQQQLDRFKREANARTRSPEPHRIRDVPQREVPEIRSFLGNQHVATQGDNQFSGGNRPGIPISKWKIQRFDGKEEHLARFLTSVKQYALAENATNQDLFRNRIYLFSGDAADWIATHQGLHEWDQLVEELIRFVQGSLSDYDRLRHIEKMKQGSENCAIFITRMEMAFQSLRVQPSAEEKRDMVIRGLKPMIRNALAGNIYLRELSDVRTACQQVERMVITPRELHEMVSEERGLVDSLSPGTFNGRSMVGGKDPSGAPFESRGRAQNSSKDRKSPSTTSPEATKKIMKCFKCRQVGHYRRDCTNKAKIYCFGCGLANVKRFECPKCSGNQ